VTTPHPGAPGLPPPPPPGPPTWWGRLGRWLAAAALGFVALWLPLIGLIASSAEETKGRKYLGFLEADWFFWFTLVGAGCCLAVATRIVRRS